MSPGTHGCTSTIVTKTQQSLTSHKSLRPYWQPLSPLPAPRSAFCPYSYALSRHPYKWNPIALSPLRLDSLPNLTFKPEWPFQNISLPAPLCLYLSPDRLCRVWPLPIVPAGLDRQDGWLLNLAYGTTTWGLVNTAHSWVLSPETDSAGGEERRDLFFNTSSGRFGGRWSQTKWEKHSRAQSTCLSPHLPHPLPCPRQLPLCSIVTCREKSSLHP